ncbi:hypothetical protein AGABI1DRAFT_58155 [Agaricus bisporus var. burnettii JB137-S8]|uniref:Peroxisome membrane anchor protein Pex14p N-terminal domain-containing protein n=1 Tax=Agaricus bisporus var. burnettii (strain JB137-S8 / ATCC MYA-4627 / FGSC 10392) TaxID=597362 RepID=K5XBC9_AGABU|nr:uncharacterized protein AGABI1DRAFT_58155 [Agaricus bisporus var. burnettii JB137-S8]EKM80402.1 hypothetical protein AGABI1DRAFT_58155 [Agaricus bisporus var. burnettii JB137-S8]
MADSADPPAAHTEASKPSDTEDRSSLLSRAQSFLQSPQVAARDYASKRQFLQEKGLGEQEIDFLLKNVTSSAPLVPPRTYPQPPPSNIPNLLLGISRVLTWFTGGAAVLVFIYYRFLLPRISQSFMARHSLRTHHVDLMRRLTMSLSSFKEEQAESFSILPKAEEWREPQEYSNCSYLHDIASSFGEQQVQYDNVSPVSLLRCGLNDFNRGRDNGQDPTTQELFHYMEEKIPFLTSAEGQKYEQRLWEVLCSCPLFTANPPLIPPSTTREPQAQSRWTYLPPPPLDPSDVVKALSSLKLALPKDQLSKSSPLQNTLQALSEFTGYISSQVYTPYRPPVVGSSNSWGPIEEQLRREIRALKGLVLNRRSFLPPRTSPSPASTQ